MRSPRPFVHSLRPALAGAALALLVAASPVAGAAEVLVKVKTQSYDPVEITIEQDTLVRWRNVTTPNRVHDVVSSIADYFVSALFSTGEEYTFRFKAGGTFTYICSIHDVMLGAVHVPITGAVTSDATGPLMSIRLATRPLAADSPFLHVVLRRDPGSETFVPWRYTRRDRVEFRPSVPGTYEFVMRVKNTDSTRNTGPAGNSPVLALEWTGKP